MKEYTYYFADGTKNTIEVEENGTTFLKKWTRRNESKNTIMNAIIIHFHRWIMRAKLLPTIQPILLKNGCGNR